jgi:hypothetical protein
VQVCITAADSSRISAACVGGAALDVAMMAARAVVRMEGRTIVLLMSGSQSVFVVDQAACGSFTRITAQTSSAA